MTAHSLVQYKKAKVVVKELTKALVTMRAAIAGLEEYKRYRPVLNSIIALEDNMAVIEYNLEYYKMVVQTKGELPPTVI